ncbi:DegT/DnrJ/EryC1/StrS family aminotransferase [Spirochaeta cellobiosiphila]|uniref:DegT/DnrJ/EryC1/StrS family aminotransferase n=1 Tax=Spirochaeta cellobiosiphila TaxID=504483 RepID=UPI00042297CE|nr:DegT/DnrJ/EryC1/StrS family aminotransferase [Spirochaeta cellobiosiphila]
MTQIVRKPLIRRKEIDAVLSCLVEDRLGSNKDYEELLSLYNKYLDSNHGILLREYKRSIEFVFEIIKLDPDDEIIISAFSNIYYFDIITKLGCKPVVIDVNDNNPLMSQENIKKFVNDKTKVIVIDNILGWRYSDLEIDGNFIIIEDFTHIFPDVLDKDPLVLGDIVIKRFDENDVIASPGGSGVFFRNKNIITRAKDVSSTIGKDMYMSDVSCSMVISQFKDRLDIYENLRNIYNYLFNSQNRGHHKVFYPNASEVAPNTTITCLCQTSVSEILKYTRKNNIATELAFTNTSIERLENSKEACPNAYDLILRTLIFPLYSSMKKEQIEIESKILSSLP